MVLALLKDRGPSYEYEGIELDVELTERVEAKLQGVDAVLGDSTLDVERLTAEITDVDATVSDLESRIAEMTSEGASSLAIIDQLISEIERRLDDVVRLPSGLGEIATEIAETALDEESEASEPSSDLDQLNQEETEPASDSQFEDWTTSELVFNANAYLDEALTLYQTTSTHYGSMGDLKASSANLAMKQGELFSDISDRYVLMTVFFALVLFFAGLASTLSGRILRISLAVIATGILIATSVVMTVTLPVA